MKNITETDQQEMATKKDESRFLTHMLRKMVAALTKIKNTGKRKEIE